MSFVLYKTRLKCLFRNKVNMFWCYIFPIVLVTCYYFAFANLWSANDLKTIKIAYVRDDKVSGSSKDALSGNAPDYLKDVLENAEIKKGMPLFDVTYADKEEAARLLENDEIVAYIVNGDEPRLHVRKSGMNETIVKSVLDSYKRAYSAVFAIASRQPDALSKGLLDDLMKEINFLTEHKGNAAPNVVLISYFALLAFTCLFAGQWGLDEIVYIQANRSNIGARINAAPVNKMKLLLINLLAAFTAHAGGVIIMVLYMTEVLNINFGDHIFHLIFACFMGSVAGIFIGAAVGVLVSKSYGVQSAVMTSIIMFGAVLSGMMFIDIKYMVAKNAPFLAYINPLNLVSDSFYSLYYFDNFNRYYRNMAILGIITVILGAVSYIGLRRKTYESV